MPHKGDLHHLLWHVDVFLNASSLWASLHCRPHFLLVSLSTSSYGTDQLVVTLSFKLKWVFDAAELLSYATVRIRENVKTKCQVPLRSFNYGYGPASNLFYVVMYGGKDPNLTQISEQNDHIVQEEYLSISVHLSFVL